MDEEQEDRNVEQEIDGEQVTDPKQQPDIEDDDPDKELHLNMYGAFQLGSGFQYLRQAGHNRYEIKADSDGIIDILETLENYLVKYNLSSGVVTEIKEVREYIKEENLPDNVDKCSDLDESIRISIASGHRLGERASAWHTIVRDAMKQEERFVLMPVPIIDIRNLVENPDDLFEEGMWENLPEQTKRSIKEACQTLSVNCATASVIMSLRGVEDILREWYKKELEVDEVNQPWGPILGDLEEKFEERDEDPDVLSNIDYLRRKRNEVNHPNRSPSVREAAITLAMVPETIDRIYKYLDSDEEIELTQSEDSVK